MTKWIGWQVMWTPLRPFPQPPLLLLSGFMNRGHTEAMEVKHGFSNKDLESPRPTCLQTLLSAQTASSKYQHSPGMGPSLKVKSLWPYDRWNTLNCLYHAWGALYSSWNRHLLQIQIYIPCLQCFCKATIHGIIQCFMHFDVILLLYLNESWLTHGSTFIPSLYSYAKLLFPMFSLNDI